jgi:hypothetical protein
MRIALLGILLCLACSDSSADDSRLSVFLFATAESPRAKRFVYELREQFGAAPTMKLDGTHASKQRG